MISVIIPVYNVEKYLERCLDSVLTQTYGNLQIICVNDGSTDSSGDILQIYAGRDARIQTIEQINQGLSCARNSGLAAVRGDYVFFLDSDDWLHPRALEFLQRCVVEQDVPVAVMSHFDIGEEDGYEFEQLEYESLQPQCITQPLASVWLNYFPVEIVVWNKLYRAETLVGLQFIPGVLFEDNFFMPLALEKCAKVAYLPCKLHYYLQRADSITGRGMNEERLHAHVELICFWCREFGDKPRWQAIVYKNNIPQLIKETKRLIRMREESAQQRLFTVWGRGLRGLVAAGHLRWYRLHWSGIRDLLRAIVLSYSL